MWSTTSQHDVSFSRDVIYITAFLLSLLISKTKQNKKCINLKYSIWKKKKKCTPKTVAGSQTNTTMKFNEEKSEGLRFSDLEILLVQICMKNKKQQK